MPNQARPIVKAAVDSRGRICVPPASRDVTGFARKITEESIVEQVQVRLRKHRGGIGMLEWEV